MFPLKFRWLHRLIRKHTNPIPENKAALWKRRLSLAYMLFAWNAFSIVAYQYFSGNLKVDEQWGLKTQEELDKPPAEYYADLLGIKRAHVIRFKQLHKTAEYNYEQESDAVE